MGKVYTTSEDLTSIANAIRAKAGTNSSLVYPTGFVSGIQGIEADTWNGIGANSEFVQTIYTNSITLAETNWKNITPSTTSQVIYDKIQIVGPQNMITLDNNYDYYIQFLGSVNFVYQPGTEIRSGNLKNYFLYLSLIYSYPGSYSEMMSNSFSTISANHVSQILSIYNNSDGNSSFMHGSSGIIYTMSSSPMASESNGIFSIYTPQIKMGISNSSMTQNMINSLDENSTTISFDFKLYKIKKFSSQSSYVKNILYEKARQDFASQ